MADNLHWTIGDVTITRIVESVAQIPPGGLLPSATPEAIAAHSSWLRPHFVDDDGNLVLSIHALGVTVGDRKIIVDTCIGNDRQIPGMEALNLQTPFLTDLADAGFPREEVDTVICTHLHFDHVGWNTMLVDGAWVPTFPNARYVLCRDEWAHWSAEGGTGYASTLDDAVRPVIDAGLADLVAPDHHVTDEIRLELTPGHTPGHVAVHIESGGQHALDHRRPRAPSGPVGGTASGSPTPTPTAPSPRRPAAGCSPSTPAPISSSSAPTSRRRARVT